MSDPGWCGRHNYRSQTTDAVCPHCRVEELGAEIERLISANEHWHQRVLKMGNEIEAYNERIEELEKANKFVGGVDAIVLASQGKHIITTAMINEAVAFIGTWRGVSTVQMSHVISGFLELLSIFNIHECDHLQSSHFAGEPCPDCDGKGYVIRQDDGSSEQGSDAGVIKEE